LVVTPLVKKVSEKSIFPDSDIPESQLDSDTEYQAISVSWDIAEARSILPDNRRMQSGRIVKLVHLTIQELRIVLAMGPGSDS